MKLSEPEPELVSVDSLKLDLEAPRAFVGSGFTSKLGVW